MLSTLKINVTGLLKGENYMETKYKIHAFYILFILIATIVVLLSVKWGDIPSLVQYFSFALTMSSLLLAILAIIYSFYSNSSNSQNVAVLNNLSQQIAQSASLVSSASDKISQQVEILPTHLISVQGKVEETQRLIKEYAEQASSTESKKQSEPSTLPQKMLEHYLIYSSVYGLYFLYVLQLGLAKNKEFKLNMEEFISVTKIGTADYFFAYYVASRAADVISGSPGMTDGSIKVTSINPSFGNKIKERLVQLAEKIGDDDDKKKRYSEIEANEKYDASK